MRVHAAVSLLLVGYPVVKLLKGTWWNSALPSLSFPLLPFLSLPFFATDVGPLNPARGSGEHCKLPRPRGVWGRTPAEIEFVPFKPYN